MEGISRRLDIQGKLNKGKGLLARSLVRLSSGIQRNNLDSISEAQEIEYKIMEPVSDRILTPEEFSGFIQGNGFTHLRRGTYRLADKSAFLYEKQVHVVSSEEQARMNLRVLQHLTKLGILHPATKWGIHQTQNHDFQLFAVTRGLHTFRPDDPLYKEAPLITTGGPHISEWIKRAAPNLDTNQELSGLVLLLNASEASHLKNWGWDSDSRILYPIDIEVVDFEDAEANRVVREWCMQNPVHEKTN